MTLVREPLSKHLPPKVGDARLARQYAAIAPRLHRGRRFAFAAPAGFAMAGAIAALAIVWLVRRPQPATVLADGTWLESAGSGSAPAVTLAEGSRVSLAPSSRVRLTSTKPDAIRIDVERGRVDVQATHVDGRTFVVGAHGYEVLVIGTRFSVQDDGRVRVHVDEGRVQVRGVDGTPHPVSAGEEWVEEPRDTPRTGATTLLDDAGQDDDDSTNSPENAAPSSSDGTRERHPRSANGGAHDAKDLLALAQAATAQGDMHEAARLFDEIRKRHRKDPRAALAAFELGRIRLDSLGDPAGADEAFRDALRLGREPGLRDDAEARRVQALERMGARDACEKAKSDYLAHHPSGIHRAAVAARCTGP